MIKEEFLHFLWKYNLFDPEYLFYKDQKIEVLDNGQHNMSSGPDFFNARIRIGDTLWAGNVEIHVKASDWFAHNHDSDPAYDNIILHLVYDPDIAVYRKNGEEIPFTRLAFHPRLIKEYEDLTSEKEDRKCYRFFGKSDGVFYQDWIGKLGITRLERRVGEIKISLEESGSDWEETLYRLLAGAFGKKQNSVPFVLLARSVPLKFVYKYRNNPVILNAAFFGQAGFLDETLTDDHYYSRLQKEYIIQKMNLPEPLPGKHLWKLMRLRPPAFPTVRIPQFINMVKHCFPFVEKIKKLGSVGDLQECLKNAISNYWTEHYLYGQSGRRKEFIPSAATFQLWILNAIIPFLFAYGKMRNQEEFMQLSLKLLEELPPENNEILKKWNKFGIKATNAFDSQALIELMTQFCDRARCTDCMIGHKLLLNAEKKRQY